MKEFSTDFGVRRDWVDSRDEPYRPNLTVLPNAQVLNPALMRKMDQVPEGYLNHLPQMPGIAVSESQPALMWRRPVFGVRHQGESGRCVGYALANLIDIQRGLQRLEVSQPGLGAEQEIVSADMLYRMAFFHDRYPDLDEDTENVVEGVRTLRSAIKGFYHHGACRDWPELSSAPDAGAWQSFSFNPASLDRGRLFPTVEQAKKAREISLGAYFRLDSVLNDFHSAIRDAGAVLCSADVHDGWYAATPQSGGLIAWPPPKGLIGAHAFVVTGYDQHGFHVLNSWGEEWGGYLGQAGIGLWPYADWAQNVIDAWVLRLGVYAPQAFGASIGQQGTKGRTASIRTGSMPCLDLVGHYMHLDDGFHVSIGSYPSFKDDWCKTNAYLETCLSKDGQSGKMPAAKQKTNPSKYKGILIWLPGSLEGIKSAFAASVQRKNRIKSIGLYPYTFFWCNDFVEKSLEVLQTIFESCEAQAGEDAEHLDDLIEQRVQGVGRAFWRDIELAARRSVRGTTELPFELDEDDLAGRIERGHVGVFLSSIMALKKKTGCEVHVVAEGAGALVFHEMLTILEEDQQRPEELRQFCQHDVEKVFDTVHLVHAAIGMPRAEKRILPLFARMNGKDGGARLRQFSEQPKVEKLKEYPKAPRARIYLPTKALEERVKFGSYGKSILHLVSRAFEDRKPAPKGSEDQDLRVFRQPRPFLGMAQTADYRKADLKGALFCLNQLALDASGRGAVAQSELANDPTITEHIFETIQKFRKT